jgi:hypothetical protein
VADLTSAANRFGGALSFKTVRGGTWNKVTVVTQSALQMGLTDVAGDLSLRVATGDITQVGPLLVGGQTDIVAVVGAVTLTDPSNRFDGRVSVDTPEDLKLTASGGLSMGVVNIGKTTNLQSHGIIDMGTQSVYMGKLKVNSGGFEIMQSGPLKAGADEDFDAGTAKIELYHPRNVWLGALFYKGGIIMINHPQLLNAVNAGTLIVRVETSVIEPAKVSASVTSGSASANPAPSNAAQGNGAISIAVARPASATQSGVIAVAVSSEVAAPGRSFSFSIESHVPAAATSAEVKITQVDGKPLPEWLRFEPATKTFVATTLPPGAFPLQLKVGIGGVETLMVINEKPQGK